MSELKVTMLEEINPEQQDSAFYCWGEGFTAIAKVEKNNRTFVVGAAGEMRINLPDGEVIRYTNDLLSAGIDTDEKLFELTETHGDDIWVHNNWFEMYEVDSDDEWWEIFDSIEEGIEAAKLQLEGE